MLQQKNNDTNLVSILTEEVNIMSTNNEKNINTLCENCCNRNDDSAKHADLCKFCQLNNNCLYEKEFEHCLKPENAECSGCCCACEYENLPEPEDCFSFYLETLGLVNEGKSIEDAYYEVSDKYDSFFIDPFEEFEYECYEEPDEYEELCTKLTKDHNEYAFDSNLVVLSV